MLSETARAVAANEMKKGDVLGAARFAGREGAKEAASYLPLSEPEWVGRITIDFAVGEDAIDVTASVESESDLGARVRALSAVTVATLTIYDMCKSADRTMEIGPVAALD
jgi:cyclic pyranopterin phosphate synthase